jgi:hypothetical protein
VTEVPRPGAAAECDIVGSSEGIRLGHQVRGPGAGEAKVGAVVAIVRLTTNVANRVDMPEREPRRRLPKRSSYMCALPKYSEAPHYRRVSFRKRVLLTQWTSQHAKEYSLPLSALRIRLNGCAGVPRCHLRDRRCSEVGQRQELMYRAAFFIGVPRYRQSPRQRRCAFVLARAVRVDNRLTCERESARDRSGGFRAINRKHRQSYGVTSHTSQPRLAPWMRASALTLTPCESPHGARGGIPVCASGLEGR